MSLLKRFEESAQKSDSVLKTRIIEIPVYYNDPWTRETLMRFRERHQDPTRAATRFAIYAKTTAAPTLEETSTIEPSVCNIASPGRNQRTKLGPSNC